MKLTSKVIYYLGNRSFETVAEARQYVEDEIGKILDQLPFRLDPKTALAVHNAVITNRRRLAELLTIEVESEDDPDRTRNLLDL